MPRVGRPPFDLVGTIVRYENGDLDEDEMLALFQYLVDTGVVNHLQGSYGREAERLIAQGLIGPGHGQNVEAN